MQRIVAILLALVLPLQIGWTAMHVLSGHHGSTVMASGHHFHEHREGGHQPGEQTAQTASALEHAHAGHGHHDGEHEGHYHPVFPSLVLDAGPRLPDALTGAPPASVPVNFISRTPPLFDLPPSARI